MSAPADQPAGQASLGLAMAESHQPAQDKQDAQEGGKTPSSVDQALAGGVLGDHREHDGGEKGENRRRLEMS